MLVCTGIMLTIFCTQMHQTRRAMKPELKTLLLISVRVLQSIALCLNCHNLVSKHAQLHFKTRSAVGEDEHGVSVFMIEK